MILVTGGSGHLGSRLILQLLERGHAVRTTVRTLARGDGLRAQLKAAGANTGALSIATADLSSDDGWAGAVDGCEFVHHVASPFPFGVPRHENDLIVPARDGTLRVVRAARNAGVKRVVLTSSFAAIGYGHKDRSAPFDETVWTDLTGDDVQPYIKSKALAERAAWDFIAADGGGLELAVINPVGIFGPVLGTDISTSIGIVRSLMNGRMPVVPRIAFGIVDVRDVADLHIRAMTAPEARGQRFLATASDSLTLLAVAQMLRRRLGRAARRTPRVEIPDWLVRGLAAVVPPLRSALPHIGRFRGATSAKAHDLLGWRPRDPEATIIDTAESLIRHGLVKR
ncbi:MAG: aldehyde reductase [Ancalomicrobiaceae bacterium]|nr:aldehyde reductase [Ancalomicrobiaceae bacterium]